MKLFFFTTILIAATTFPLAGSDLGPSYPDLNFGVVISNSHYTIYRSEKLGRSGLRKLAVHLQKNNLPFPKTVIYMHSDGYKFPSYFALEEYEDLESGVYGDVQFYHPFGPLRTYVDGKSPYFPSHDIDAENILGNRAKEYFQPVPDNKVDGGAEDVLKVLEIVLNPDNQPVLYHCLGGRHRTGMVSMLLRYMQGGDWLEKRNTSREKDLNLAQYEYSKFVGLLFRKENLEFVDIFQYDRRFQKMKATFGPWLREH